MGVDTWNKSDLVSLHVVDLIVVIQERAAENPFGFLSSNQGARAKILAFHLLLKEILFWSSDVNMAINLNFQSRHFAQVFICTVVNVDLSWKRIVAICFKVLVDEITLGSLDVVDIFVIAHDHTGSCVDDSATDRRLHFQIVTKLDSIHGDSPPVGVSDTMSSNIHGSVIV